MAEKLRLASSGGDIKIWDMPELNMVKAFSPHSQPVGSLCWSPNSILIYSLERLLDAVVYSTRYFCFHLVIGGNM